MGLSVAERTLAWHDNARTCKCARDSAVGAIYRLLRVQMQEDSRAVRGDDTSWKHVWTQLEGANEKGDAYQS